MVKFFTAGGTIDKVYAMNGRLFDPARARKKASGQRFEEAEAGR